MLESRAYLEADYIPLLSRLALSSHGRQGEAKTVGRPASASSEDWSLCIYASSRYPLSAVAHDWEKIRDSNHIYATGGISLGFRIQRYRTLYWILGGEVDLN